LAYTARGWAVFPVVKAETDVTKKSPKGSKRIKDATNDYEKAQALFDAKPGAEVALALGKISNLCVLVVDPSNGGDHILQSLEMGNGSLPETVRQISSDGKEHIFFNYPEGITLKKYAREKNAGLYLLTDGDFVLVQSSMNDETCPNLFDVFSHPGRLAVCDAPAWLFEGDAKDLPQFLLRSSVPGFPCNRTSKYGDLLLEIADNKFLDAVDEDWKSALLALSYEIAIMFKRGRVAYDEAFKILLDLWLNCAEDIDPEPMTRAHVLSVVRKFFRTISVDYKLTYHSTTCNLVYLV
jgi:hypothetical protein